MNYKKSFLFVTAVLALMLCFSFGVSADPQIAYQDEVAVNVPELEQYMEFPDETTVTVTDRHTGSYYVADVSWDPADDQYVMPGVPYSVVVTVEAAPGVEFTEDSIAFINGYLAEIIYKNAEEMKIAFHFDAIPATPPSMVFYDVSVDDWFFGAVEFVYYNGIMNGMGDNIFAPNGTTSRAMVVTVLYRMEGSPSVAAGTSFADVPNGEWYSDAVKWAAAKGIVNGYSATSFGPNDPVTREQLACIMFRFAQYKGYYNEDDCVMLGGFTDQNKISDWAMEAASWAVGTDLVKGIQEADGLYFRPQNNATRAQIATILERFCDYFNYFD